MKKKVSNIEFADSSINSFRCQENSELEVIVRSWDQRKVILTFNNIVGIQGCLAQISDFFEEDEFNQYANEALRLTYLQSSGESSIPRDHPYKNYIFHDSENQIALQVIAESVIVKKTSEIIKGNEMSEQEFVDWKNSHKR